MIKLLMSDGNFYTPSEGEYFVSIKQHGNDESGFFRRSYPTGTIVECIGGGQYLSSLTPFSSPPRPLATLSGESGVWEKWSPDMKDVSLEDYL